MSETLKAQFDSAIVCPSCNITMVFPIDPRTGIQDRETVHCQTRSCKNFDKKWQSPTVTLKAVEVKK